MVSRTESRNCTPTTTTTTTTTTPTNPPPGGGGGCTRCLPTVD
jgi:hypothetical protein